ncbi:hypothetical protein T439DRAFT_336927 [Meredithblackwellia eburnea MCA 4105]
MHAAGREVQDREEREEERERRLYDSNRRHEEAMDKKYGPRDPCHRTRNRAFSFEYQVGFFYPLFLSPNMLSLHRKFEARPQTGTTEVVWHPALFARQTFKLIFFLFFKARKIMEKVMTLGKMLVFSIQLPLARVAFFLGIMFWRNRLISQLNSIPAGGDLGIIARMLSKKHEITSTLHLAILTQAPGEHQASKIHICLFHAVLPQSDTILITFLLCAELVLNDFYASADWGPMDY